MLSDSRLEELKLRSNAISCVEYAHRTGGGLPKMRQLDLEMNALTAFPPFQLMPSLTTVSLSYNRINATLPASIGDLSSLTEFQASNNLIPGPIPNISALNQLKILQLSNNLLSSFPSEVISRLEWLDLSNNLLTGSMPYIDTSKVAL